MEIGLLIIGGSLALIAAMRWYGKRRLKLAARETETRGVGDMPPCKETCDIHGKAGEIILYECGHDDHEEFKVDIWGEPKFHKKPAAGKVMCSACLVKEVQSVSIRCACCGYAIMPGDPISLCAGGVEGKKEWRTVIDGNTALCLRWACDAAPGFCGHWTGKGIKPAFPDGGNMISQAFNSGQAQVVEIGPLDPGGKEGS